MRQVRGSGVLDDRGRTDALLQAMRAAVRVDISGLPVLGLLSMMGALDNRSLVGVEVPANATERGGLLGALARDGLDSWLAAHPGVVTGQ